MASEAEIPPKYEMIAAYLDNPTFSDFTIQCGSTTWKVHRMVLGMHSDVLHKACDGDFKESTEQKIDLSVHEEQTVDALVKFMYTGRYSTVEANSSTEMCFHLHMVLIADKYNIKGLEHLAKSGFEQAISEVNTAEDLVKVSTMAWELDGPLEFARERIVSTIVSKSLLSDFVNGRNLHATVIEHSEMESEVVKAMKTTTQERKFMCDYCGNTSTVLI